MVRSSFVPPPQEFCISVTFEMRTVFHKSCLFNDNCFPGQIIFISNGEKRGREQGSRETKRERGRECECGQPTQIASVGNPVVRENMCLPEKIEETSGDRLRLIRNMRKQIMRFPMSLTSRCFLMVNDISSDGQFIFPHKSITFTPINVFIYTAH